MAPSQSDGSRGSTLDSSSLHSLIQLEEQLGSSFVVLDSIDAVLQRNALARRVVSSSGDQTDGINDKHKMLDNQFESPMCVAELEDGFLESPISNQSTKKIHVEAVFETPIFRAVAQRRWSASPCSSTTESPSASGQNEASSPSTGCLTRVDSSPAIPRRNSLESSPTNNRSHRRSLSTSAHGTIDSSPALPRRSTLESSASNSSFDSSPSMPRRPLSPGSTSSASGTKQTRRVVVTSRWDTDEKLQTESEYSVLLHDGDRKDAYQSSKSLQYRKQSRSFSPKRNTRKMSPKRSRNSPKTSKKSTLNDSSDHLSLSQHSTKRGMRRESLVRSKSLSSISLSKGDNNSNKNYKTPRPRRSSVNIPSKLAASALLELLPIPESPDALVKNSSYDETAQQELQERLYIENSRSFEDFKIARRKGEKHRRYVAAKMKRKKDRNSVSLNDIAGAKTGNAIAASRSSANVTQNATWDCSNNMKRSTSCGGSSNDRWETSTTNHNTNTTKAKMQALDARFKMAKHLLSQNQRSNVAASASQLRPVGGRSSTTAIVTHTGTRRNSGSLRAALGSMAPGGWDR